MATIKKSTETMKKFTIHTPKDKFTVIAASTWQELTLEQLIEIELERLQGLDTLKAFSILTGLELQITANLIDKNIESTIWDIVSFLTVQPNWEELKPPKKLFVGNNSFRIPTKIGHFMIGQKILLQQAIIKPEDLIKKSAYVIALMMQPTIDKIRNKGDLVHEPKRIAAIEKQLLNSNGLDCYSVATFFFAKFRSMLNLTKSDLEKFQSSKPQTIKLSKNFLKEID